MSKFEEDFLPFWRQEQELRIRASDDGPGGHEALWKLLPRVLPRPKPDPERARHREQLARLRGLLDAEPALLCGSAVTPWLAYGSGNFVAFRARWNELNGAGRQEAWGELSALLPVGARTGLVCELLGDLNLWQGSPETVWLLSDDPGNHPNFEVDWEWHAELRAQAALDRMAAAQLVRLFEMSLPATYREEAWDAVYENGAWCGTSLSFWMLFDWGPEEAALRYRASQGEREAQSILFGLHLQHAIALAWLYGARNQDAAQEAAQDGFVKLLERPSLWNTPRRYWNFVFRPRAASGPGLVDQSVLETMSSAPQGIPEVVQIDPSKLTSLRNSEGHLLEVTDFPEAVRRNAEEYLAPEDKLLLRMLEAGHSQQDFGRQLELLPKEVHEQQKYILAVLAAVATQPSGRANELGIEKLRERCWPSSLANAYYLESKTLADIRDDPRPNTESDVRAHVVEKIGTPGPGRWIPPEWETALCEAYRATQGRNLEAEIVRLRAEQFLRGERQRRKGAGNI